MMHPLSLDGSYRYIWVASTGRITCFCTRSLLIAHVQSLTVVIHSTLLRSVFVRQALRAEAKLELDAKMVQAREETGNNGFIISALIYACTIPLKYKSSECFSLTH